MTEFIKHNLLRQTTLIPLSFAVVVIGGGSAWMTKVTDTIAGNKSSIMECAAMQKEFYSKMNQSIRNMENRLGVIEGELKRIRRN